ncbi:MAG TPA: SgcJ/EcaC family oxidoreductase [Roseiarcus sp.]
MPVSRYEHPGSTSTQPGGRGASGESVSNDEAAIRRVMASYNDALNSGSATAVLPLYAEDAVFMPPFSQSAVGKDAVRVAYDTVFRELSFDVRFTIAELVIMAPSWAYVRTNSAGTTGHASTGKTTAEANQELFIFRKDDGAWRIARYSFSPTNPPSG